MYFRRSAAVAIVLLFLSLAIPARAAGFGDYVATPLRAIALAIESAFTQLAAFMEPHPAVTVQIPPAPWHASGTSATAAVFNATVASLQPQADTAASTPPPHPTATAQSSTPSPGRSNSVPPAPTLVLTASAAPSNYVTQDELKSELAELQSSIGRSIAHRRRSPTAASSTKSPQPTASTISPTSPSRARR
jgi:hypothetical protein